MNKPSSRPSVVTPTDHTSTSTTQTMRFPRWYRGFRTVARRVEMIQAIGHQITRHHLHQWIASLRIEKQARGEFYFFIGIDGAEFGQIPEEVEDTLFQLSYFRNPVQDCYLSEITKLVSSDLEIQHYGQRLKYHPVNFALFEDPFDQSNESQIEDINPAPWEDLLNWLSAVGAGSWQIFQNTTLFLQFKQKPRQVLRNLRVLGYLETSADGSHWSINPPMLVGNENTGFDYLGQRSQDIIDQLTELGEVQPFSSRNSPNRLHWKPSTSSSLEQLPKNVKIVDAEEQWLTNMPSLIEWQDQLESLKIPHLERFEVRQFTQGSTFEKVSHVNTSGMYQFFLSNLKSNPKMTLYYQQETQTFCRADWYGLRFLTLQTQHQLSAVKYDVKTKKLAILAEQRFPELYERVLVLLSGQLPQWQRGWLIYENITTKLIQGLAHKLSLKVE